MADTSENPDTQETEHVTAPQAGDLGQQLKRCREKAGLDIEQAASEMRLSPHLLRSLEEEDFQTLPEPPYVRGYLRSYAKLSDNNPNQLISIYEGLRGGDGDFTTKFTPLASINTDSKPGMSSFTAKLLGFLLLIAVLGGLSMMPDVRHWASNLWSSFSEKVEDTTQTAQVTDSDTATHTGNSGSDTPGTADDAGASSTASTTTTSSSISIPKINSETTETTAETASDGNASSDNLTGSIQRDGSDTSDTPTTDTSESSDASENTDGTADTNADTTSPTDDEQTAAESTEDTAATEKTDNDGDTTASPTDTNDETNGETPADDTAETASSTDDKPEETATDDTESGVDTTKQPIDGQVTIRMEFEQEVWLQIRNTEDKPIFETLKSSGRQELQAHTPLKFKVGNAPGVKIYLNGVLFDQKPHTRGNVAKFEVK